MFYVNFEWLVNYNFKPKNVFSHYFATEAVESLAATL